MKSRPWFGSVIAAIGLAASILTLVTPAQAAKRVALVIGNNDYKNVPKLQKAVNDARTMGEVRIGIDNAVPYQVLKMPPCDKDSSAIAYDAKPYLKLSPTNQFVSVELTYRDGSVSEIKSFRR
jgi:hypothetical protein